MLFDGGRCRNMHQEPYLRRYSRRVCSTSLVTACAALLWFGSPLLIPVFGVRDLLFRSRFAWTRAYLFFLLFFSCEVIGVMTAVSLWIGRVLHPRIDRERFLEQNFQLQRWWTKTIADGAMGIYGMRVEVDNRYVFGERPVLLLVRHASALDTFIPARFISVEYGIQLRYVLKKELLWDPCLDIVGHRLPNYFLDRSSPEMRGELDAISKLATDLKATEGVLIFPEGTRYTETKRERVLEKLRASGNPADAEAAGAFRHVLPPRPAGALRLLEANGELEVVVCAHTGFEGSATFRDLLKGRVIRARVRIRFWPAGGPAPDATPEEKKAWLYALWEDVDRFVEEGNA